MNTNLNMKQSQTPIGTNPIPTKKKGGCLKVGLIILGVFVALSIIGGIIGSNSNPDKPSNANVGGTAEEIFARAQTAFDEGHYLEAVQQVDAAIKKSDLPEYQDFKTSVLNRIEERKQELAAGFDFNEDKVENITFIVPKNGIQKGLIFYPYIGIKDSNKYMLLRVGYQESTQKASFVFTAIKVRTGEDLEEIPFGLMDKVHNIDLLGSGITEYVDVSVKSKQASLLNERIPATEEVLIRLEDVSNKSSDYTLSDQQKNVIANILEYYSYLE